MSAPARLERSARLLEYCVLGTAGVGVLFRLTWYWHLPKAAGASFGSGDVVDFALTFLLFAFSTACASCGVASALRNPGQPGANAYRPLLVGVTVFVAYYFLAPQLPRLW